MLVRVIVVLSVVVQVLISVLIVRVEVHSALLHQCIMACFIHLIIELENKGKKLFEKRNVPVRAYVLVQSASH